MTDLRPYTLARCRVLFCLVFSGVIIALLSKQVERFMMSKQFNILDIGDTFSGGVSYGVGINVGVEQEMIYKKISKSKAECIAQRGYGNTRAIGNVYAFAPYQKVYNASKV